VSESLAEHGERRLRLAGRNLLEKGNPWFASLDALRDQASEQGRKLVSFANYDYLGLAEHASVKSAAINAVRAGGVGAQGSRLVGGERRAHGKLERSIAEFLGFDACLTLVSGFLTNQAVISHLMTQNDLIVYDQFSHNSIRSGSAASHSSVVSFRHNDLGDLRSILERHRAKHLNCLVVVEGLYSMDGDIPDLPALLRLKAEFNFWLLVDEAHSFGVLGATGRGLSEHYGTDPMEIDLLIGTLSKTLGACGGFVCASGGVIEWLKYTLGGFVYSVGLPPVIAASALAALDLLVAEPHRVTILRENSQYFLELARGAGLDVGVAEGVAVIPVMFPDLGSVLVGSDTLLRAGYYAPPIVHVGVPKDAPRIRFFISTEHERADMIKVVQILRGLSQADGAKSVGNERLIAAQ
jgi:8-amino-7-oxononanoate synthase